MKFFSSCDKQEPKAVNCQEKEKIDSVQKNIDHSSKVEYCFLLTVGIDTICHGNDWVFGCRATTCNRPNDIYKF